MNYRLFVLLKFSNSFCLFCLGKYRLYSNSSSPFRYDLTNCNILLQHLTRLTPTQPRGKFPCKKLCVSLTQCLHSQMWFLDSLHIAPYRFNIYYNLRHYKILGWGHLPSEAKARKLSDNGVQNWIQYTQKPRNPWKRSCSEHPVMTSSPLIRLQWPLPLSRDPISKNENMTLETVFF